MIITVARHAWAYEYGDPRWPDDSHRPLEDERRARYELVVSRLAKADFAPNVIATSPYVRCVQTAEIIAAGTAEHPEIVPLDALKPGSDLDALLVCTRKMAKEGVGAVCWVGHAPDVGSLTGALVADSWANIRFAKGSVAAVRMDEIARGGGELLWHATAKLLGA